MVDFEQLNAGRWKTIFIRLKYFNRSTVSLMELINFYVMDFFWNSQEIW